MNVKYLMILAAILVIVGAILQIIHFWGEIGLILMLCGLTMGFIGTILEHRNKKEQKTSPSITLKILMFVSSSLVIIGAILKITHTLEGVNDFIIMGGFILTGVYYFPFSTKSQS